MAWETPSQTPLSNCSKEVRGVSGHIQIVLCLKSVKHKNDTAHHKEQVSKVNDFSAFLWEGAGIWDH